MLEILNILLDKPLNASLIGARLGIEREMIVDMVADMQAKGLVKEVGNKLAITAEGIAVIRPVQSPKKESEPDYSHLKPEVLLPHISNPATCSLIVKKSGHPLAAVKALLPKLVESGKAVRYNNGQYKAVPIKTVSATPAPEQTAASEQQDAPAAPVPSFDVVDLGSDPDKPVPPTVAGALENLRRKLSKRQINELPTKLAVLNRLAEILEPSIAEVLTEIGADLEAA